MLRRMLSVSLLLILPAILIPVLVTSFFSFRSTLELSERNTQTGFRLADRRISEVLTTVNAATYRLEQEDCVYDYLFPASGEISVRRRIHLQREIDECVRDTLDENDALGAVIFLREDGPVCGATLSCSVYSGVPGYHPELFEDVTGTNYQIRWLGLLPQQDYASDARKPSQSSDYMVFGVRTGVYTSYTNPQTSGQQVAVLFALQQSALLRCCDQLADSSSQVYLLGSDGRPLLASEPSAEPVPFFSSIDPDAEFSSFRAEVDGVDCQIMSCPVSLTGWVLAKVVPYSVYTASSHSLIITALISGAIALVLLVLLFIPWGRRFCAPIREVTSSLRLVQDGDLSVRLPETADTQEPLYLEQQFNRMLDSLNELLRQRAEDEREKLAFEMRSLQAQITPHFIYNTITSIRFTAQMRGDEVVANMLISLVRLLRPIFSEWTPEWTLTEELAFCEHYMTLMRMRSGDRVRFLVDDPGALGSCPVPRFILQPVLENSCEHTSLSDDRPPLEVHIGIREDIVGGALLHAADPALVLTVRDTGDGIPADRLSELRRSIYADEPDSRFGIGLRNVHRRIRLNYGTEYGLSVDSAGGQGTTVELRLRRVSSPDVSGRQLS